MERSGQSKNMVDKRRKKVRYHQCLLTSNLVEKLEYERAVEIVATRIANDGDKRRKLLSQSHIIKVSIWTKERMGHHPYLKPIARSSILRDSHDKISRMKFPIKEGRM